MADLATILHWIHPSTAQKAPLPILRRTCHQRKFSGCDPHSLPWQHP